MQGVSVGCPVHQGDQHSHRNADKPARAVGRFQRLHGKHAKESDMLVVSLSLRSCFSTLQ